MGCTGSQPAQQTSQRAHTAPPRPRSLADPDVESQESEHDRLYAFKDTLRKRALPLIEARSSCENMEAMLASGSVYSDRENFAALRIQKQLKRKQAKVDADKEQKWMIFSNLDAFDEAEMVKLAAFMESAMKSIAGAAEGGAGGAGGNAGAEGGAGGAESSISGPGGEAGGTTPFPPPRSSTFSSLLSADEAGDIQAERSASFDKIKLINMDQLAIAASYNKTMQFTSDFDLPAGQHITPVIAKTIIDVYKHGGRLSTKAVTKLLRLTYRKLQTLPNTTHVRIDNDERLTIVGDIHGQLPDLLHILGEVGQPSAFNKYIFNGDFVDRGPCGVEVMCILMSLYLAHPEYVILNRGNHEDFAICCVYGFQKECCEKYDYEIFGMFSELFQHLPLFAVVNNSIFVLHGGLFHAEDILLSELNEINRTEFSLRDLPEGGEPLTHVPRSKRAEFLKQLQRDALWSDPMMQDGLAHSSRGAGVNFGPDVAAKFLELNNLKMVVRSHEVCRTGFELPFGGREDAQHRVATIFSASNYSGGGNSAAYMTFTVSSKQSALRDLSAVRVPGCDLQYRVYYFHIDQDEEELFATQPNYTLTLHDLISKKKEYLIEAFELADARGTGVVTQVTWAEVMQRVLQLPIRWLSLVPELVQKECMVEDSHGITSINYNSFLAAHSASIEVTVDGEGDAARKMSPGLVDSLYAHHKELFAVFSFFDKDGDGMISREEFRAGCDTLNRANASDSATRCIFQECDSLLEILDVQGKGQIEVNDFFEMFRVSDTLKHRRNSVRLIRPASFSRVVSSRGPEVVDISGVHITSDPELAKMQSSSRQPDSVAVFDVDI